MSDSALNAPLHFLDSAFLSSYRNLGRPKEFRNDPGRPYQNDTSYILSFNAKSACTTTLSTKGRKFDFNDCRKRKRDVIRDTHLFGLPIRHTEGQLNRQSLAKLRGNIIPVSLSAGSTVNL